MGMYTQIRGWLNIDSIGYGDERFRDLERQLEKAKEHFLEDDTITVDRKWVCHDTHIHNGCNGSVYIFFGTELKNYGNPAKIWIEYLLNYFPNAEGSIDFQYEELGIGDTTYRLLIYKGQIIKEEDVEAWCYGYGNLYRRR